MKIFKIFLLCIALSGCATVGSKIDKNSVSLIKEGITTRQEVVELLGKPYMVNLTSDSKTIMMYHYVKATNKASNFIPVVGLFNTSMDMEQQILQVLLDENDVVEKYIYNDSENEINSGLLNTR